MSSLKYIILIILLQLSACAKNTTGVDAMNTALTKNYSIKNNPQNNTISYLKNTRTNIPTTSKTPQDTGFDFLHRYRKDFLLENPLQELTIASNKKDKLGFTRIKLNQSYRGIPVWKGIISMHFNRQNTLHLVQGQYFPTPSAIDINAGMTLTELFQKASQINPSISQQQYSAQKIIFFRNEVNPRLAYELKPTRHANLASNTLVLDAITGDILNQLSAIKTLR
ncbi:MAG: hypothetical protein V3V19_10095 [Cocleimonas sp.]